MNVLMITLVLAMTNSHLENRVVALTKQNRELEYELEMVTSGLRKVFEEKEQEIVSLKAERRELVAIAVKLRAENELLKQEKIDASGRARVQ